MSDGLDQIEQLAGALLRNVGSADRQRILRRMARYLQRSQSERIGRQRDPDGAAFAPRRAKEEKPGNFAARFLYPKGAAEPRLVFMKSWVRQGPLLTGYDAEAGGIRSFFWDRVAEWLPVEAADQNRTAGRLRRKGTIRQKAMFRKLRNARNLRADATDREAWVGFTGRAAQIARIHQEGGRDRVALRSKEVRYAQRRLLGLTTAERSALLDLLFAEVTKD